MCQQREDGRVRQGGSDAGHDDRLTLRKRRPSLVDAACEHIRTSIMSGVQFPRICKAILPYYLPLLATLLLVTVFPALSVWLPNLIYAK